MHPTTRDTLRRARDTVELWERAANREGAIDEVTPPHPSPSEPTTRHHLEEGPP